MIQSTITFPIRTHIKENNPESQNNLDAHKDKFSKQCSQVLNILLTGERLTVWDAMVKYHIGHLPRRIADLRASGIDVQDEWINENGSRFKRYFILKSN